MLKLFRTYSPFSVIALLVITFVVKLFWLIHPEGVIVYEHQKAWGYLLEIVHFLSSEKGYTLTVFSALNLAGQAIYLNRIATKAGLFNKKNYLPALCFILLSSFVSNWNYLSAPLLGNWFLLIAADNMMKLPNANDVRKLAFNMGFAVSCAGIFIFPYFAYLLFLLIGLALLRPFRISEWVITILGFMTPIYLLVAILFLSGKLPALYNWLPTDFYPTISFSRQSIKPYIILAFFILISIVGFVKLNEQTLQMLMQVRRKWTVMLFALFIGILPLLSGGSGKITLAFPIIIFLSLIAANAFLKTGKAWPTRILFYLFLAVLIFAQWIQIPNITF